MIDKKYLIETWHKLHPPKRKPLTFEEIVEKIKLRNAQPAQNQVCDELKLNEDRESSGSDEMRNSLEDAREMLNLSLSK